jgi:hypothetical protein
MIRAAPGASGVQFSKIRCGGAVERPLVECRDMRHRLRPLAVAERVPSLSQSQPLAGAEGGRVGADDLLGQGRAGARHADDEDRCRIEVLGARAGVQASPVEGIDRRLDKAPVSFA